MIPALILGLWILISGERPKQAFWEASLFTCIAIAIHYLMNWHLPEINAIWLLSWFLRWLFVFVAFWLTDVLVTGFVWLALFAVLSGFGYFLLDAEAFRLATSWLS